MSSAVAGAESAAAPPRRWRRWWWLLLLVPAAVAGWLAYRESVTDAEFMRDQRARAAEEQPEILARPRGRPALIEPASQGSATGVVAAFLEAVHVVPAAERDVVPIYLPWEEDLPPEAVAVLAAHPEPVARLTALLGVPSTPAGPQFDVVATGDDLERHGAGTRWLGAVVKRAVRAGPAEQALELALVQVAYASEIAWGGHQVHDLFAGGVFWEGLRHLAAALGQAHLDAAGARRARMALERLQAARIPAADVIAVEAASLRHLLLDSTSPWRRGEDQYFRRPTLEGIDWVRSESLAAMAGEADAATTAVARMHALANRPQPPLLKMQTASGPIWAAARARTLAWLRVCATALAVAEFAAEQGRWPESLDMLVPGVLASVPVDPWSSAPLRYRPGVVWSVGQNGTDEGGTPPEDADEDWRDDYAVVLRAR